MLAYVQILHMKPTKWIFTQKPTHLIFMFNHPILHPTSLFLPHADMNTHTSVDQVNGNICRMFCAE